MPQVLDLKVETMLAADAEVISHWRYPGQYALHDGPLAHESERAQYLFEKDGVVQAGQCVSG